MIANETTSRSAGTTETAPTRFTPMHWFTTALGIVIAIACLLVLVRDLQGGQDDRSSSVFVNTSTSGMIDRLITAPSPASAILAIF